MKCIVYGLYSSRDPGELRYIGQTVKSLNRRLVAHHNAAISVRRTAVHKWMDREKRDGFVVEIRALCVDAVYNVTEMNEIARHRVIGTRLLNHTDGGGGSVGFRFKQSRPRSAETRAKLSAARKGKRHTPESRAKLSAWRIGTKLSDETRARMSVAQTGRVHSEATLAKMRAHERTAEHCAKLSQARIGHVVSPETRAKISATLRARAVAHV